jgi:hypothetical protein
VFWFVQVGEAARDREAAKNVQCSLEYTTLKRVTEATEIYYDPIPDVRLPPLCRPAGAFNSHPNRRRCRAEQVTPSWAGLPPQRQLPCCVLHRPR